MQHYFLQRPLKTNSKVELPNEIAHHWISVVRAQINDQAEFVDDNKNVYLGKLIQKQPKALIQIKKVLKINVEMPLKITIASGLPKKNKADLIVQKSTEMGANQIIFFPSDWSIAKWRGKRIEKKVTRLNRIAKHAAEQSHRNIIPDVKYTSSLNALLKYHFDYKLVAYEESAKKGEKSALKNAMEHMKPLESILAIFGPEGGISPSEIKQMNQSNVLSIGLGPRILRTETAPLYLLAAFSTFFELKG